MSARDRRKEHHAWKQRVARGAPELAARVFALRGKAYPGYGYHYALEKALGTVIAIANTYEYQDVGMMIVDEVIVEGFHEDLAKAEKGAA